MSKVERSRFLRPCAAPPPVGYQQDAVWVRAVALQGPDHQPVLFHDIEPLDVCQVSASPVGDGGTKQTCAR